MGKIERELRDCYISSGDQSVVCSEYASSKQPGATTPPTDSGLNGDADRSLARKPRIRSEETKGQASAYEKLGFGGAGCRRRLVNPITMEAAAMAS